MSFTRFHDDPARISKSLEQSTFAGRYQLDTPGQGTSLPYMADPQMRIQKWGANMMSDSTNLESELFCLGRPLNHDYDRTYRDVRLSHGTAMSHPVSQTHVMESRASNPAWMYRDLEQTRWETPFFNPIANVDKEFTDNISTRIQVKDTFVPDVPNVVSSSEVFSRGFGTEY